MNEDQLSALQRLASALSELATKKSYWVTRRKRRKKIRALRIKQKYNKLILNSRAARELVRKSRNGPCTDCGVFFLDHMSFDHLPGQIKKFDLGKSTHRLLNTVKAELAKCELVCCRCHDKRERARGLPRGHTCRRPGFCPLRSQPGLG